MQIKTLQLNHSCPKVFDNFHMDVNWLADEYLERFRAHPTWSEKGFIATVQAETSYKINHTKAWRV